MAGFDNEVMNALNVDFRGVKPVVGQMTADGDLLIGSTVAPYIKKGKLTSLDGSATITNGSGTIDIAIPNKTFSVVSPSIDMTTIGVTTLFTPTSNFVWFLDYQATGVDQVAWISGADYSIGSNAATYDNMKSSATSGQYDSDEFERMQFNGGSSTHGFATIVPAGTPVRINVTVPAIATSNHIKFIITGVYI